VVNDDDVDDSRECITLQIASVIALRIAEDDDDDDDDDDALVVLLL